MVDACRARPERHATRVAQTTCAGTTSVRWSPSPMVNAATGPDAQEQQGSCQPATEHPDGRTATLSLVRASGSASHAWPEVPHGWRALSMATELLRYRPAPDRHNDWLQCIEELVAAAGNSAALSCLLQPQPSQENDKEQDAPPPRPWCNVHPEPRQEARPRDRPCEPRARPGDEVRCEVVPRPRTDARVS
ncbi:hypothetical protein D1007_38331 [Hordeum vulgare]|nr:hypothetical protein D1007_38331 [Hordeum vulgare]